MSQAMPWIAEEVGLFRKYDLDFQLVYISSSQMVTAAILGGDGQMAIGGGEVDHSRRRPGRNRPGIYRQREKYSHA